MMTTKYRSKTAVSIASRAVHVGGHLATDDYTNVDMTKIITNVHNDETPVVLGHSPQTMLK